MKANGEHDTAWIPTNLVAGCFPRMAGKVTEMLTNAAAEACGTSRFHAVCVEHGDDVLFIAAPSSDFAGHPNTWCPFADALGDFEKDPRKVAYTVMVKNHTMHALIIDPNADPRDQIQLIQDTKSRVEIVLGRLGFNVNPDSKDRKRKPVFLGNLNECQRGTDEKPWVLFHPVEERIIHWTVKGLLGGCAAVVLVSLAMVFQTWTAMALTRNQIDDANQRRAAAQQEVQKTVADLTRNPVAQMLSHLDDTSQRLLDLNGWLTGYRVVVEKDGMPKRNWHATLPQGVTGDSIARLGATTENVNDRGEIRIVGN